MVAALHTVHEGILVGRAVVYQASFFSRRKAEDDPAFELRAFEHSQFPEDGQTSDRMTCPRRRYLGHVCVEHLLRGVDQDVGVLGREGEVQIEPVERVLEFADRLATPVAPGYTQGSAGTAVRPPR